MTDTERTIERIRAFKTHKSWGFTRLATEAGINKTTLRAMDLPGWNPTKETIVQLERIIPAAFQIDEAVNA